MKHSLAPYILIVVGIVFLLQNLGIGDFNLGHLISKWWPLILIALGLSMLFKRSSK